MLESLSAAGSKPSRRNKQTSETAAAPRKQKTNKHLFLAGSLMQGLTTPLLDKKRVSTKYQSVSNELMAPRPMGAHCAGDPLGNSYRNECDIPEQQKKAFAPLRMLKL